MNVRIPTASNRIVSAFSGFAALLALAAAGCGGGGGATAVTPTRDTRAASINTVQGARKVGRILGTTTTRAESSVVVGSGPIATSLTPTLDTLRRIVRPLSFIGRNVSRDAQTATFDPSLGLYRTETVGDDRVVALYFEDSAKTRPVGTTEATVDGSNRVAIRFDVTGGAHPTVGDLTLTFDSASAQNGTVEGEVRDPKTDRKVAFKMKFSGDVMTGDAIVSSAGTVKLSRVISYSDGRLEADVDYAGTNGHLIQKPDLSGSLSLNESAGQTVATYDADGAGTLALADGSFVPVSSFDAGS